MSFRDQIPACVLFFFSVLFSGTWYADSVNYSCSILSKYFSRVCANDGFEISVIKIGVASFAALSAMIFLWLIARCIRIRHSPFTAMLNEIRHFYSNRSIEAEFAPDDNFTPIGMKMIMQDIQRIFSSYYGAGRISVSFFYIVPPEEGGEILMEQIISVRHDGSMFDPPYPVKFRSGEGFVGLAWRHKQIRMGQKKYLWMLKNKAFKDFSHQDDSEMNSFFCCPVFFTDDENKKSLVGVLAIDSKKSIDFGALATRDKSFLTVGDCLTKVVGVYSQKAYHIPQVYNAKILSIEGAGNDQIG